MKQRPPSRVERIVARKVDAMKPSGIRIFFDLVLGMKDVVSLGVGEPDFVTPWLIREAGISALEQGFTSYTSNKGLYKLRLYICRHLKQRFGLEYCPDDETLITVGVSEGLDLVMRAILDPGDQVLVPLPSYVSYGPAVELAGGEAVYIDTRQNRFRLSIAALERAVTPKTKAILFAYPNNPTGVTYGRRELSAIQRFVEKHDLLCISDELYGDLTYDHAHVSFPTLVGARERTVLLNGFSKNYAMTGWRVGYACGPRHIIGAMTKIHQYTMLCSPIVSQMAACEALQSGEAAMLEMKREYRRRRDYIGAALDAIGFDYVRPEGAFYIFISVKKTGMSSLEFAQRLLAEQKVAVVPGTAFGDEFDDYIRVSYASAFENIKLAMARIKEFLKKRKR